MMSVVFYLVCEGWHNPIQSYLNSWGEPIAKLFSVRSYQGVFANPKYSPGLYIFSDLERLSPIDSERVARYRKELEDCNYSVTLLNHPTCSMRRYELLRHLYNLKINTWNIYRATDVIAQISYPVFLKKENDHTVSFADLIYDQQQLKNEIQALGSRGISREDTVIIEYCDSSDSSNIFRKYSAFSIKGKIIPGHVFFSNNWLIKIPDLLDDCFISEELEYVENNPHEEQLKQIFNLAQIAYGRIDYSVVNNQLQVWEINTNPQIASFQDIGAEKRKAAAALSSQKFNAAIREQVETHLARSL